MRSGREILSAWFPRTIPSSSNAVELSGGMKQPDSGRRIVRDVSLSTFFRGEGRVAHPFHRSGTVRSLAADSGVPRFPQSLPRVWEREWSYGGRARPVRSGPEPTTFHTRDAHSYAAIPDHRPNGTSRKSARTRSGQVVSAYSPRERGPRFAWPGSGKSGQATGTAHLWRPGRHGRSQPSGWPTPSTKLPA